MIIYCTACRTNVDARLTDGEEIYPHRPDLHEIPMWICDTCDNSVGTHHKSNTPLKPLGFITTPQIKRARMQIHDAIDDLIEGGMSRGHIYAAISKRLGYPFHAAEIKSMKEARQITVILREIGPW